MSARRRLIRRSTALLLVLALGAPAVATARPAGESPAAPAGKTFSLPAKGEKFVAPADKAFTLPSKGEKFVEPPAQVAVPSAPAPTVVRTIVKEEAVRVLPIALAGAALLIAIGGAGYAAVRVSPVRPQLRGQH